MRSCGMGFVLGHPLHQPCLSLSQVFSCAEVGGMHMDPPQYGAWRYEVTKCPSTVHMPVLSLGVVFVSLQKIRKIHCNHMSYCYWLVIDGSLV